MHFPVEVTTIQKKTFFLASFALLDFLGFAFAKESISFSGSTWTVKNRFWGPGPNQFSASNAFVDSNGNLHLKIQKEGDKWTAAEVYKEDGLSYGTYTWTVKSDVTNLNENVVLGLFTWDTSAPQFAYREIDIEISKWKVKDRKDNSQFVVQPYQPPGNLQRFNQRIHGTSIWKFTWTQSKISFSISDGTRVVYQWDYLGKSIPPPATTGGPHMNLWMVDNTPPSDDNPVEVVIQSFSFVAASESFANVTAKSTDIKEQDSKSLDHGINVTILSRLRHFVALFF